MDVEVTYPVKQIYFFNWWCHVDFGRSSFRNPTGEEDLSLLQSYERGCGTISGPCFMDIGEFL
jgi:hypothetical protein